MSFVIEGRFFAKSILKQGHEPLDSRHPHAQLGRAVYSSNAVMPVHEESELGPSNPYGWSKLMAEQVLRDIHAAHPQLSIAILRYFNPVGAHASGMIGEDPAGVPANLMPYMARVADGTYPALNVFGTDYPALHN
ncbi:NAD-dependent epimerase/dehydratase family protein [Micrococcus terreus]|uniref:NAD-dependent epimerase/dehydratase family protein n=1 Tax=Micrococcus terreus TaxID=574650 RepID=UPI002953EF7E|nr:NAD-dependent epimerase/dehydratase family protein [Micrococcus terreus]WOO96343.1 NAD-dependent epimerase/dehydratase family protein [Micrococcus terreus]